MKRGQLGGELVGLATGVIGTTLGGDRIHTFVVEASIIECARPFHFSSANISVPVGYRPEPRPGVQVYASQTVGRGNQRAGSLSVWSEAFPIFVKLRVKTARTPTAKYLLHSGLVHSQLVDKRFKVGR